MLSGIVLELKTELQAVGRTQKYDSMTRLSEGWENGGSQRPASPFRK